MDPNYGQQINPVSRLIQIQQVRKEPEPKFELVDTTGQGRFKEYVIQVRYSFGIIFLVRCFIGNFKVKFNCIFVK